VINNRSTVTDKHAMDQQVYDALFDAMLSGRLKPGERLAEVQLCEQFKVSRTVVRQALRRLAELRVVNIVANKGATVASPSPQEALEVFEARRAIEGAVVRRLAKQIGQSDVTRLRQRLRAEHDALHSNDHPKWAQLAGGFHIALAEIAGSAELLRLMTELLTRCTLIVALYEAPGNALCEHEEHDKLVDLLALHDGESAVQLMDLHIQALQQRLVFPA
jgi:DNA-binding GntR family transcriptional regulator